MARVPGDASGSGQTRVLLAALAAALVSLALAAQGAWGVPRQQVDEDPQGTPYVAGELLVIYEPGIGAAATDELPEKVEGQVEEEIPEIETQLLTFPEVKRAPSESRRENLLQRKKAELQRDPAVESVSFNYVVKAAFTPNDARFEQQWGMRKVRFPRAWDEVRGRGIDIAVVDTGIDNDHPDLRGKVAKQRNFVTDPETNRAEDDNGHGTHVSGIAAAVTDNGTGVAGACPQCRLLVAKSLDALNEGTVQDVAEGIVWSADNGAEVMNLSVGVAAPREDLEPLEDAVNYAWNKGVVVVAAAGNLARRGNPTVYPAAYENTIAVAATTIENRRAGYSSFGDYVDVAAPGGDDEGSRGEMILSTYLAGGYEYLAGTSMAAPHVAGLAGLLAAQGRSRIEIRNRIERTARDLGPTGKDEFYGHGLVDAAAAVGARPQPPPNTAPRISDPRPRPGSTTKARRPTVSAIVRDRETDLRKSNITLIFDGKKRGAFGYDRQRDRLSFRPANRLAPGNHSVRIIVRDGRGLKDDRRWTFKVKQPGRANEGSGGPFATIQAPGYPFNVLPDRSVFNILWN